MTDTNVLVSRFREGWARNKDIRANAISHYYVREEAGIARAVCVDLLERGIRLQR